MGDAGGSYTNSTQKKTALSQKTNILDAAISCFEKCGYFETTFADIATQSGLEVKEVIDAFPSKDEALGEYITRYNEELRDQFEFYEDPLTPHLTQIYTICKTTLVFLRTHKVITAIWFEFYRHNVAKVVLRGFFAQIKSRLGELVKLGIEDGTIKKNNERDIVEAIIALVEGTLIISRLEETTDFEQRFEDSWSIMEGGLKV